MAVFSIIRLAVLITVLVFAIIVLGLSANTISLLDGEFPSAFSYAGLGLAIAILTLITLAPMVIIEFLRRGALTSWLVIEMGVCFVLAILWLATAATASGSDVSISFSGSCSFGRFGGGSDLSTACHSWQAIQAFGYLNWIFLKAYACLLLVLAILAMNRGHKGIWQTPVSEVPFFNAGPAGEPAMSDKAAYPQTTGQHSYPPQNYPQQAYTPPPPQGVQV